MNLGEYADITVTSIKVGEVSLGTNTSALDFTGLTDKSMHGETTVTVEGTKNGDEYVVNVPVLLVTKYLATATELKDVLHTATDTETKCIFGYYKLTADLSLNGAPDWGGFYNNGGVGSSWANANQGFRGTFDGAGHTLTGKVHVSGLFNSLGTGAVVKNVNFSVTEFTGAAHGLFGIGAYGTTFENIMITVSPTTEVMPTDRYLLSNACSNNTFKNLTVYAYDKDGNYANVATLFGNSFSSNTFENTVIYCASLGNIGGSVTTAEGFKLVQVKTLNMARQEYLASETAGTLTLSNDYEDITVTSIKVGEVSVGTSLTAVNFATYATDETKHGEIMVTIEGTKDGNEYVLNVPVLLVTKYLTTATELKDVLHTATDTETKCIFGYYKLTADLSLNGAPDWGGFYNNNAASFSWSNANQGFRGTFDGAGYNLTGKVHANGLFNSLGNGAVVKNVNFTVTEFTGAAHGLFGIAANGTTFENITITVRPTTTQTFTDRYLLSNACSNNTFKNVTVYAYDQEGELADVATLFGTGFGTNTFENVTIHCKSLGNIGSGTTTATGVTVVNE